MTDPPAESPSPAAPRFPRRRLRWLVAVAAVLVLAVAARIALPYAVAYGVERWLTAQGAREVAVRDVTLGLWSARLALADVRARRADGEGFVLSRLEAVLDLPALLDRRVLLRELVLDGAEVAVVRDRSGGWRIGGFSLAGGTDAGAAASSGWSFGVRTLDLRRVRIHWQGWGISDTLAVDRLGLANLVAWDPASPLTVDASLGLRAGSLGAKGSARPFAADRTARLEIDAAALPLSVVAPLLRAEGLSRLAGSARLRATLTAAERDGGLRLSLNGDAALNEASADAAGAAVGISGLRWQGSAMLALGPALSATMDGTLSLAGLEMKSGTTALAAKDLGWTASWRIGRAAGGRAIEATATGALTAGALSLSDGAGTALGYDSLNWQGTTGFRFDPGHTVYADAAGKLELARPRGEGGGVAVAGNRLTWQGRLSTSRAGPNNDVGLLIRAALSAEGLTVRDAVRRLDGGVASVDWEGTAEFDHSDSTPELFGSADGRISLRGVRLDDSGRGIGLAAAERVAASGLFLDLRRNVLVRDLELDQPRLLAPTGAEPVIAARSLFVDNVGITAQGIDVGAVNLDDAQLTLVHEGGGRLAVLAPFLAAGDGNGGDGGNGGGSESTPPVLVALGPVSIAGKSRIAVEDRSVDPPFRATVEPVALSLGAVRRDTPAADSALALDATLRPHTRLTVKGTVRPLAPRPTLALTAKIDALDLAPLSRYAERDLGYALKTGQLDAQAELRVDGGRMKGRGALEVRRLDVKLLDKAESKPLRDALPVSLETALALLRDDANRIRVTVPVSGDMADPKFDLSDVVNQAIGGAIADTVTTTLKVLFPVGALAAAAIDAATADRALRFRPLAFAPGDVALGGDAATYLDQLARLLRERPMVRVSLCAVATEADRQALVVAERERRLEAARRKAAAQAAQAAKAAKAAGQEGSKPGAAALPVVIPAVTIGDEALTRLAGARATAALRYLVQQKGIASKRLPRCRPSIDKADKAAPRLDVVL